MSKDSEWGDVAGAGIAAGAQLIGGLLSAASQAEREKQRRMADAESAAMKAQSEGASSLASGSNRAFASLMDAYRSALTGGK